jgi:hypothetical protein
MAALNGRLVVLHRQRIMQLAGGSLEKVKELKEPGEFIVGLEESDEIVVGMKSCVAKLGKGSWTRLEARADQAALIPRFARPRVAESVPFLDKVMRDREDIKLSGKRQDHQANLQAIAQFVVDQAQSKEDRGVRVRILEE